MKKEVRFILDHLRSVAFNDRVQPHVTLICDEFERLDSAVNSPELADFVEGVKREAVHQVERWGAAHDQMKTVLDWYWTLGHLAGKAAYAHLAGDRDKAKHHTITAAALLFQWHAAIEGGA